MTNNSAIQIINSEKAVASILSNFSSDFIMDVIEDNIRLKFRPYNVGPANFATVLEQNFRMLELENPSYMDQIEDVRAKTHREIIRKVCQYYNLQFIGEQYEELSTAELANVSTMIFDIFVTRFTQKMIWFFGRYILDNKDDIYNSIENVEELKKNKDITAYGRRLYSDPKLIMIHANLNIVLSNIAGHDISLNTLLHYLAEKPIADYLSEALVDCNDIYKYHYASYIMNPITRPDIFTVVKFELQSMADKTLIPTDKM